MYCFPPSVKNTILLTDAHLLLRLAVPRRGIGQLPLLRVDSMKFSQRITSLDQITCVDCRVWPAQHIDQTTFDYFNVRNAFEFKLLLCCDVSACVDMWSPAHLRSTRTRPDVLPKGLPYREEATSDTSETLEMESGLLPPELPVCTRL